MTTSLATPEQLAAVCPDVDPDNAQNLLDQATVILQSETGQTLLAVDGARVLLDSEGANVVLLPEVPVRAVDKVVVEGVELTPDEYEWSSDGMLRLLGACAVFPQRFQSVDVIYDHGFDPIPADLALAACGIACRLSKAQAGQTGEVTFEAVGSYQVRYATAVGLTSVEASVVNRYRVGR